jgi:hypothetical protein
MDRLDAMSVLIAVAEAGSLSAASEHIRVNRQSLTDLPDFNLLLRSEPLDIEGAAASRGS